MNRDLTTGSIIGSITRFSLPMIIGNIVQQFYNIVDTLVVGKYVGAEALAAVGSAFTLMVFLTSAMLGLCMGSGAVISQLYGAGKHKEMKEAVFNSFVFIGVLSVLIFILSQLFLRDILVFLNIEGSVQIASTEYLRIILTGIGFVFLSNFFSVNLRSIGDSKAPLIFLSLGAVTNIALDYAFVAGLHWGIKGAAAATVIAQGLSASGLFLYFIKKAEVIRPEKIHMHISKEALSRIAGNSILTSIQQSVMNFGILLVQGLVNSFGVTVMAAFAASTKIDAFAYMPLMDFGNGVSTFVAQNYGAGREDRLRRGIRHVILITAVYAAVISLVVVGKAEWWIGLFTEDADIITVGVTYLRIEGMFYIFGGWLFVSYGLYRGLGRPGVSVVLTFASLGNRVILAYMLAPVAGIGVLGIWWAIPIGWFLADVVAFSYYMMNKDKLLTYKGAIG